MRELALFASPAFTRGGRTTFGVGVAKWLGIAVGLGALLFLAVAVYFLVMRALLRVI